MPIPKKTVLVVEDEAPMLEALSEEFIHQGFAVFKARDGEEGLAVAMAKKPDVVVLDIIMPQMDGLTMLKKLRADTWGKDVPVVFLTNVKDPAKEWEACQNGVSQYLVKSNVSLEEVVKQVQQIQQVL